MIAPIVPPQAPLQELLHGQLTPPVAVRIRSEDVVYGMSTVGDGGRLLDRRLFGLLGWVPGTRLDIRCDRRGVLLVGPTDDGDAIVTRQDFFRVPYRLRRRVNLFIGDRVLLIGRRSRGRLAVHPPVAMDEMFTASLLLLER